ncbi:hypothetical protein GTY75_05185 [Streptomyces sp. SID8381]|uniref:hypothetical protein n=1 Tax=unclassified Streptomyces TaxID=2593676 RepID=UPI00037ED3EA|nr:MULTISPECIES: hypothetical protein [unclassified Streptomyces]MYX26067.1 hypothetical protein [Streptomyces sp. SID8381]
MSEKLSRTKLKEIAQDALMQGIGNQLGYWKPEDYDEPIPENQRDELREVMQREADRVARLFGYEKAWSN